MRLTRFVIVFALIALMSVWSIAEAKKGGNGGGGGKPGGTPADPAIVYVKAPDLMVMDADGGNASVLVAGAASTRKWAVRPHWSPDGSWVVFNSQDIDGPGIYVASRDGAVVKRVASSAAPDIPKWGPVADASGNHLIVFMAGGDLHLLRLDPTTLDPVDASPAPLTDTNDAYSDWDPTWAPDGRTIAAFRDLFDAGGGTYSLVLYKLDEALVVSAPIIKVENTTLTWGVVGQELDFANGSNKLVMMGGVDTDFDIYTVDLGADPVGGTPSLPLNITNNTSDDEQYASWSSDDSQILYYRNAARKSEDAIMVMNADGSNAVRLGKAGGWPNPDWK